LPLDRPAQLLVEVVGDVLAGSQLDCNGVDDVLLMRSAGHRLFQTSTRASIFARAIAGMILRAAQPTLRTRR
jgi:hypothetical protein